MFVLYEKSVNNPLDQHLLLCRELGFQSGGADAVDKGLLPIQHPRPVTAPHTPGDGIPEKPYQLVLLQHLTVAFRQSALCHFSGQHLPQIGFQLLYIPRRKRLRALGHGLINPPVQPLVIHQFHDLVKSITPQSSSRLLGLLPEAGHIGNHLFFLKSLVGRLILLLHGGDFQLRHTGFGIELFQFPISICIGKPPVQFFDPFRVCQMPGLLQHQLLPRQVHLPPHGLSLQVFLLPDNSLHLRRVQRGQYIFQITARLHKVQKTQRARKPQLLLLQKCLRVRRAGRHDQLLFRSGQRHIQNPQFLRQIFLPHLAGHHRLA